jgi:Pyruvate/2-oxoacid:ferredoxin oxidoreductase delta subunit
MGMRHPGDDEKKFLGRLRTSIMGLREVAILEKGREKEEREGGDERKKFFEKLGDSWGSRIIPIERSISVETVIIPGEDLNSLVERALVVGLSECYCRTRYKNCDHPTMTCVNLSFGESFSSVRGRAPFERASLSKVKSVIAECHERGLIHQTIFYPSPEYFYTICNCCDCCCIPLNNRKKYGMENSVVTSRYRIAWDKDKCGECLSCLSRCHFEACAIIDGGLNFDTDKCYGCGLCVTTCPRNALKLVDR